MWQGHNNDHVMYNKSMKTVSEIRAVESLVRCATLNNKINYSFTSFYTFMTNHFWTFLCWVFGTYLLPVHSMIYIMMFMITIDFITGIWKALKNHQPLTSKRMGDTIEKCILYMIGIITSFVLQQHIGIEIVKPLWIFSTLIITREYISVIENIESITGTKLVTVIKSQLSKLLPESEKPTTDEEPDNKTSKPE